MEEHLVNHWGDEEETSSILQQMPKIEKATVTTWGRIGTYILDLIFLGLAETPFIIFLMLRGYSVMEISKNVGMNLISMTLGIIYYFVIPIYTKGQTLGKKVNKSRVIHVNGEYATNLQLILRFSIYFILNLASTIHSTFGGLLTNIFWISSLIFMLSCMEKQALHDKIVKTIVVYDEKYIKYLEECQEKQ